MLNAHIILYRDDSMAPAKVTAQDPYPLGL